MYQATGISSKHILVAVLPGLPTSAELFILPYQDATGENKRTAADLEQVLCPLLGKVYVYAFVCIYMGFPRQVRTNNCGTNASDSLGSKRRLWYMLHTLWVFLLGFFGGVGFFFRFFFSQTLETGFGAVFRSGDSHLGSLSNVKLS